MHKKFAREGFTLIELSFSILFISILSLAVALLIVDAITAYRRGITLNQVNNTGMEVVDDMRMSIQGAQAKLLLEECSSLYEKSDDIAACTSDNAHKLYSITKKGDVEVDGETIENVPIYGAFCSDSYSYIWNSGYIFNGEYTGEQKATLQYKNSKNEYKTKGNLEGNSEGDFKLLKVLDEEQEVCRSVIQNDYDKDEDFKGNFDIRDYNNVEEEPEDILAGDTLLALYDLSVDIVNESETSSDSLYMVSFILGTVQGGIDVKASGNYCAAPEDFNSNFNYCAINKFNFVAQANGG